MDDRLKVNSFLFNDCEYKMQSITTDKQEPIVKFVAQLRRYGMALLFPQRTHDFVS